jgi:putative DNA primase/helicase
MRALDTVYSWHMRNKKSFEYSKELDPEENFTYTKGPIELFGWITKDAIYYDPDKLQEYLVSKGFNFERVIQDWKDKDILEPTMEKNPETGELKYKSWKKYSFINGQRIKGVKIPFSKMKEILEIREEDIYDMKKGKVDIEEIYVPLIDACSRFLAENPELKNVTHPAGEVADMFIKSKDREELLLYGRENIVKAFKLCKKEA